MRFFTVLAASAAALCAQAAGDALGAGVRPRNNGRTPFARRAPNLLKNSQIVDASHWELGDGVSHDQRVSRKAGGCIRLTAPGSRVVSTPIPVTPGKSYTVSAFMKVNAWPAFLATQIEVRDEAGNFLYNAPGGYQATSEPERWQEITFFYTARPGDARVRLQFIRSDKSPRLDGEIWLDDFYFGEGMSFDQPPAAKQGFDGLDTRIDALGNFEIRDGDNWKPFFPICIYNDNVRPDYRLYSAQGFNCLAWSAPVTSELVRASDAKSKFNPNGMMMFVNLSNYTDPRLVNYGKLRKLESELVDLKQSPFFSRVIGYYWDNEAYNQFDSQKAVISLVRRVDSDASGKRRHPIVMLDGQAGTVRAFSGLVDAVEQYLRDPYLEHVPFSRAQTVGQTAAIVNRLERQPHPNSIGVISEEPTGEGVRRLVYEFLMAGGKGIAYYRDGSCSNYPKGSADPGCKDITRRPAWTEFPKLRTEIDQLLPLIRQPIQTDWSVSADNPSIELAPRDYQSEAHVFIVNPLREPQTFKVTLHNLSYRPASVNDYFSGAVIGGVASSAFTVKLKANQTAVYRLVKPTK